MVLKIEANITFPVGTRHCARLVYGMSDMALLQALQKDVLGQVNTNKHHLAGSRFPFRPLGPKVTAHQLVHTLENHFAVGACHA